MRQIIEMGRNNDYRTSNLLDYEYFSKHYKLIGIDWSKQIELENLDLKQQINFIGKLEINEGATMFFIIKKSEETTFKFLTKFCNNFIIMNTQKIANLLGNADNESLKFATRKWYVITDQNNTDHGAGDENGTTIKFETKVIKSNLCDYSDAYILVIRNITVRNGNENTKVAFENGAPFTTCVTNINDEHVDNADNLDIIMLMYNLTEYSANYSDTSGRLWQFKIDEQGMHNGNPIDTNEGNSSSFK